MSVFTQLKRVLFGKPIHRKHAHHQRLPNPVALPVFASDALSSVAYATEEIMIQLGTFGSIALFALTIDFALAIAILIVIVAVSYYQTIHAYPSGGGSYIVSRENLGPFWGQVAAASLLIDYILTVSVSVSAGVLALVSLAPAIQPYIVPVGVTAIAIIMFANLRGARESGIVFSVPTYGFIGLAYLIVIFGFFKPGIPVPPDIKHATDTGGLALLTPILALKAFSSGCTALTGIEAISNGTQAFREPVARNASKVLISMALILSSMFLGISFLAEKFHVKPMEITDAGFQTVIAQITQAVFGKGAIYSLMQVMTAGILILAANTAFADFPRLASLVAKDGYLPRQLMSVGDRMVFQNGIIVLSMIASGLLIFFGGDTNRLIGLYAVGVFLSFTLSQFGMVVHQRRAKKSFSVVALSALGGLVTLVVTIVVAYSKWSQGAGIVPIAIAVIILFFTAIKRHYNYLASELSLTPEDGLKELKTTAILLVPRLHRGILHAISYARTFATDVRAIHVTLDPANTEQIKSDWNKFGADIPLVILESPYRSLIEPVIDYIDETMEEEPDAMITVIVPQAVPKRWWHGILHNNAAIPLKLALASRKNVVITNVRYFLK